MYLISHQLTTRLMVGHKVSEATFLGTGPLQIIEMLG